MKKTKLALKRSTITQLTGAQLKGKAGAACGSAATCDAATCASCNCTDGCPTYDYGWTCYSCYVLWCHTEICF